MKVYVVRYDEDVCIGDNSYEINTVIDGIYISEEKANARVEELKEFSYYAWIDDRIVIE